MSTSWAHSLLLFLFILCITYIHLFFLFYTGNSFVKLIIRTFHNLTLCLRKAQKGLPKFITNAKHVSSGMKTTVAYSKKIDDEVLYFILETQNLPSFLFYFEQLTFHLKLLVFLALPWYNFPPWLLFFMPTTVHSNCKIFSW